jgi:demethylmenaquinone methyltransferase/2-methoxy-6-polyprenyl-1,4-benzoquinol methylase
MLNQPSKDRAQYVNKTFSRIARHYDLMNRLMTAGMDLQWRKKVIRLALPPKEGRLLDLGSGTGDLARAARRKYPGVKITAADFTREMMTVKNEWQGISRTTADATELPFSDKVFDTVISGFLMRNVVSVEQCLREQYRVLKPGGRIVILDTTRPRRNLFAPLVKIYLSKMIPLLGTLITGDKEAYTYLPESTQNFLLAEDLAARMKEANFINVTFEIKMFGTIAIHSAFKS